MLAPSNRFVIPATGAMGCMRESTDRGVTE
jgi:hypothetical protein